MKIYDVTIPASDLKKIPEAECIFLIQLGHIANELLALHRLQLMFTNTEAATDPERAGNAFHELFITRLLSGKLHEAWEMLRKDFFGSGLSKSLNSELSLAAQQALDSIKQYFGKENRITKIRNSLSFHFGSSELKQTLAQIQDDYNFHLYLHDQDGNSLYSFAEEIVAHSMLTTSGKDASLEELEKIVDESLAIARNFLDLIGECCLILTKKYLRTCFSGAQRETVEIVTTKRLGDLSFPFFLQSDKS